MSYFLKKIFLYILYSLVHVKRGLVWIWGSLIVRPFLHFRRIYQKTLGKWTYKFFLFAKRRILVKISPHSGGILDFFGKRSTLQAVLFIVVVVIMIPHTRLYTMESTSIAGRNTLLYSLVGPGDQDFASDEIFVDEGALVVEPTRTWREGSVSADTQSVVGEDLVLVPKEIASISAGGTAVTKPTILPGVDLPVTGTDEALIQKTGRTKIVQHTIEPGDTLGGIAEKYDVSVATILWANDLSIRSVLRLGQTLEILPVEGLVHTVKRGDTVSKIAKLYDAEMDQIISYNKLQTNGADIVIGEELVVPGGVKPQPKRTYVPPTKTYSALRNISAPPPSAAAPAGSGYLWPTSVRTITQYFGWRHTGLDIAGPMGSAIYAAKSGTVVKAQAGWNGGYGTYIIIDHGGGVHTLYAHNSQLYVSVGEKVTQGQTIAAMGSTGRSTGPHIHFEVRINGAKYNPLKYIR